MATLQITSQTLSDIRKGPPAYNGYDATQALGPLCRWWLTQDALQKAGRLAPTSAAYYSKPPSLDQQPGTCAILFVFCDPQSGEQASFFLHDAFALPLQWEHHEKPDTQSSSAFTADCHLPSAVADLGQKVHKTLAKKSDAISKYNWSLHLAQTDGIREQVDLSQLGLGEDGQADDSCDASSGWVPLAAALLLYAEGGHPNAAIMATGIWDDQNGLLPVGHLQKKIDAAHRYGATHFFIPEAQRHQDNVRNLEAHGLIIGYLPSGWQQNQQNANPLTALNPLLAELEVPPQEGFDEKVAYQQRQYGRDRKKANDYYLSQMLGDVIERCRQNTFGTNTSSISADQFKGCTLVAPAGLHSDGLLPLTIGTLQAKRCLVLASEQSQQAITGSEALLRQYVIDCPLEKVSLAKEAPTLANGLPHELLTAIQPCPPGTVVWDTTPAQKYITIAMLYTARPGDWLIYLQHEYSDRDQRIPGKERLRFCQVGHWFHHPHPGQPQQPPISWI